MDTTLNNALRNSENEAIGFNTALHPILHRLHFPCLYSYSKYFSYLPLTKLKNDFLKKGKNSVQLKLSLPFTIFSPNGKFVISSNECHKSHVFFLNVLRPLLSTFSFESLLSRKVHYLSESIFCV